MKDEDDEFEKYAKNCSTCNAEFVNLKEEGNLTRFYYQCKHTVGLVISNQVRQKSIIPQVEKYLEKDLDVLYSELAKIKDPTKPQIYQASIIDFVKEGKSRFDGFRDELFTKLCIEYQLCSKLNYLEKLGMTNKIERVYYIIAAALGTVVPVYIPISLLSAIILKDGLKKFCNCN